jgi:replication initiation protein RepC
MTESLEPSYPLARPSGARRLSLSMLMARDSADTFTGLPCGSAKPLRILAAFQEAEPYLGLPAHAFKLVSYLVQRTQPQDWEEGSRPIAWPSAREVEEFLSLSPTRRKALERALFEAGILVMRDHPQGKRYGRRDKTTKRITEAFGYDLTPLAQRQEEFIRVAAAAKIERDKMKALRRRVTLARRAIRQAGEALATLDRLPASWPQLEADTANLVRAAKNAERSEDLALIVASLERRKNEAEQVLRDLAEPVEKNPMGSENGPHFTTTNLTVNLKDTVIASKASGRPGVPSPNPNPPVSAATPDLGLRLKPSQLVELAPRLNRYLETTNPGWAEIVEAADWLRADLGVSASLWAEACLTMGREYAATAIAVVSTKDPGHFKKSPGGYFAGMVRKAARGELHLERTIWKLRTEKYGPHKTAAGNGLLN